MSCVYRTDIKCVITEIQYENSEAGTKQVAVHGTHDAYKQRGQNSVTVVFWIITQTPNFTTTQCTEWQHAQNCQLHDNKTY